MIITSYESLANQGIYNMGGQVLIPNPSVVTVQMVIFPRPILLLRCKANGD